MAKPEKRFNEARLLEYKETNDEVVFGEILKDVDIKKYIRHVCNQKLQNSPSTLYSIDDMLNIAYIVLWQCIHKYKFICPVCGLNAKTHSAYKIHVITRHEEYVEPSISISRYVKFNLGAYLQNEIRKEYSQQRQSNVLTVNIFTPDEETDNKSDSSIAAGYAQYDLVSHLSIEDEVVFNQLLPDIVAKFDGLTKEVFNYMFYENMKQREIAVILHEQGRYSSEQSAAVIVSRVLRDKIKPIFTAIYFTNTQC